MHRLVALANAIVFATTPLLAHQLYLLGDGGQGRVIVVGGDRIVDRLIIGQVRTAIHRILQVI